MIEPTSQDPFETHFEPLDRTNVRPKSYSNVIEGKFKCDRRRNKSELQRLLVGA